MTYVAIFNVVEKFQEIKPKNWISGSFYKIFKLHSLTPYGLHPNCLSSYRSHKDKYNSDKFHQYKICGSRDKDFQSSAYQLSIHKITLFRKLLGPYSPKYSRYIDWIVIKFALLVQLWTPFFPENGQNKRNKL